MRPLLERQNFLDLSQEFCDPEKSFFVILPVPYERTTTYKKGTKYAPHAIVEASSQVELLDEELFIEAYKAGIYTATPFILNQRPEIFLSDLCKEVEKYSSKFLIMVGGEHTITEAAITSHIKKFPQMSALIFDAHADLREQYIGDRYSHACVSRRISKICPVVQVGVRSVSEDEYKLLNSESIKSFLFPSCRDVEKILPQVLKNLNKHVYISIDMDVFDPSLVPGVGTPAPGGFLWYDMLTILKDVINKKVVIGCDIVEICPVEHTIQSEFVAAKLIYKIISYIAFVKEIVK
jgi:agmatinase